MDVTRDMMVRIEAAGVVVEMCAESVSWSPDVAADMCTRAVAAFTEVWEMMLTHETE